MTDKLPPNLLMLFAPRPPIRYLKPTDKPPAERKTAEITGLAAYLPALKEYKETDVYNPTESWLERKDRIKREKEAAVEALKTAEYNPSADPNIRGDAFKTLIVARLSYDVTEQDLEHEFGRHGNIERIRLIRDTHADEKSDKKKKKPHRGYAFIVFDRERDMRAALDQCDGIRLKGRAIKVDVERGRTVKDWRPRRLGGGIGGRNYTRAPAGRPGGGAAGFRGGASGGFRSGPAGFDSRPRGPPGPGGGFRGGFRGSFRGGERSGGPPTGPSGDRNGFGGRDRGFDRGPRGYDDRSGGRDVRRSGSNLDPVRPRDAYRGDRDDRDRGRGDRSDRGDRGDRDHRDRGDRGRGDRDERDYDRPSADDRKRRYDEGSSYDEPRKIRRY